MDGDQTAEVHHRRGHAPPDELNFVSQRDGPFPEDERERADCSDRPISTSRNAGARATDADRPSTPSTVAAAGLGLRHRAYPRWWSGKVPAERTRGGLTARQ
jgi:hypothetical protein